MDSTSKRLPTIASGILYLVPGVQREASLHSNRLLLTYVLLSVALIGCRPETLWPENSIITVENQARPRGADEDIYQVCLGGLQATLRMPGLSIDSGKVEAGETYSERASNDASDGDAFEIEAWCFDEEGIETGYIKAIGKLNALPGRGSTFVEGPLVEGIDFVTCVETDTFRGVPPCIQVSPAFVVQ